MKIQKASEASGLSADTIRFYEKRGVLPPPPRRANGYRDYTAEHIATLRLARALRDLGLPLSDVALILPVAHDGTCGDLRDTLAATLAGVLSRVETQIRDLAQARDQVAAILDGLRAMRAQDRRVPGLARCECVALVTEEPGAPAAVPRA